IGCIDPALRLDPFLIKAAFAKFFVGHKIRNACDLPNVEEQQACHGVKFHVRFVELDVVRIDTELIEHIAELAYRVLRKKPRRLTANEPRDRRENIRPTAGIQRRVINAADEMAQLFLFGHEVSTLQSRSATRWTIRM